MRTNGKQPVVILALNRESQEADLACLRAAGVTNIEAGAGSFEGITELAYCIPIEQFTDEVRVLLHECEQQAVMFLDNQYNAWFSTADKGYPSYSANENRPVYVGEFREVSQLVAQRSPGYSHFGGKYYVARH